MSQQDTVDLTELAALQQSIIGGSGLLPLVDSSDTLGIAGNVKGQDDYFVRKPWLDPPDGSIPVDVQFGISLPGLGFGLIEVVSFRVPEGFDAVINGYNCNFTGGGFVNFSGDIVWQMQIDSRPVEGLEVIQNQRGTVEFPRRVSPFRVKTGQLLQFFVNHVSNIALNGQTICGFWGYRYPRITGQ